MLAATTCALRAVPSMGSPRTNAEWRGSVATTSGHLSPSASSTQSPVASGSAPVAARTIPSAVSTFTSPRSTRDTRPGVASG